MSRKYKIRDQEQLHFVTFTVVNWIDVFIRREYKDLFLDSVRHCQQNKGLEVYAWCIMTSHVHMILRAEEGRNLEDVIRDLKSFTSRSIRKLLEDKESLGESRREWMYWMMQRAGHKNCNNSEFQFWQQHNHPIELSSNKLRDQKRTYIHNNPVEAGFVQTMEMWQYSSAQDYTDGGKGLLDILYIE
ncbi:MAG: transposase [Reichenbachiella sp.]